MYAAARSGLVLFVADLFHPVGGLAVETFLNGDMRHSRGWRGAVPVFLTRLEPDHVTWPNVLDRTTPALYPAAASRHDQVLAQRVAGSNVTLAPTARAGSGASNRGSMRTAPVKYSAGPLPEGCEPLLLMSIF